MAKYEFIDLVRLQTNAPWELFEIRDKLLNGKRACIGAETIELLINQCGH